jgi:hypothetical protein
VVFSDKIENQDNMYKSLVNVSSELVLQKRAEKKKKKAAVP